MIIHAIQNFNLESSVNTVISLVVAFALGSIIGYERQYRQRTAGLRTIVLVTVGAALFVDMADVISHADGITKIVPYIVSGIGFLGAGAIMRENGSVTGLNTAATLWASAAVGACAGADLVVEAILGTVFILIANTLLRPIANRIRQTPIAATEVDHE